MSKSYVAPPSMPSDFTFDESLKPWNSSAKGWLIQYKEEKNLDGIATGNVVFNSEGKVLVIQRASHDSMPNKWELPGGAVDDEDATILHGAARELLEESSLIAKRFLHIVTEGPNAELGQFFSNSTQTKLFYCFAFRVEVESCDAVRLDPHEHQDFAWATEEEIRDQRMADKELPITKESVHAIILEAFRLKKVEASVA